MFLSSVRSVRATWRVPRITGSRPGQASTWIAAQSGSPPFGPFIQVGVVEIRYPAKNAAGVGIPEPWYYGAFWSDTDHNFHPEEIFPVMPGDRIAASLTFARHRWIVAIDDVTNDNVSVRFATRQEATRPLGEAAWLQEDAWTTIAPAHPDPYPMLAPVRFSKLSIDGQPPPPWALRESVAQTPESEQIVPSPVRADSFDPPASAP